MRTIEVVITCEHAGNKVPPAFRYLFAGHEPILASHRGWDPGALAIARHFSKNLKAPLFYTDITRLLADCNRSTNNSELLSEFTDKLSGSVKKYLLKHYYHDYRDKVAKYLKHIAAKEKTAIIHLSVHTFTPVLHDKVRMVDIGLLFDDTRTSETAFCKAWKDTLSNLLPGMIVMHNCPYHGADDGFTTWLRNHLPESKYLGIEIEVNQKYAASDQLNDIKHALSGSFKSIKHLVGNTNALDLV